MHGMRELLVGGLGVDARVTGLAPIAGLFVGAIGLALNTWVDDGDLRAGALPWTMIAAVGCLALCVLGVMAVHGETITWPVVAGGWWCVIAFCGIAGFFLAIGIGTLAGIEEDNVPELLGLLPVMSMAFGLLSMTPALAVLAFGASRARVLPRWGSVALWIAAPALPVLLILGGTADGAAATAVLGIVLSLFAGCWIAVGLASRVVA